MTFEYFFVWKTKIISSLSDLSPSALMYGYVKHSLSQWAEPGRQDTRKTLSSDIPGNHASRTLFQCWAHGTVCGLRQSSKIAGSLWVCFRSCLMKTFFPQLVPQAQKFSHPGLFLFCHQPHSNRTKSWGSADMPFLPTTKMASGLAFFLFLFCCNRFCHFFF